MHTKDRLAEELRKAGLIDMAVKAANGIYHDYLSPLPDPAMQLLFDLEGAGTAAAMALKARHLNGEFDATFEESEAWAGSPDGKAAFDQLINEAHKRYE
jgi:hypothetical protein